MKYINKNTGDLISKSIYNQLTDTVKLNFIISEDVVTKTHSIVETKNDSLSVGDSITLVALSPLLIIKSLF